MFKPVHALVLLSVLSLAACATGPLYHPSSGGLSSGYSETSLGDNRYRITFVGGDSTPAAVVQDYALLRAAELTLNKGYTWFYVVSRQTVPQDSGHSGHYTTGYGSPFCGVYGCWGGGLYGGILIEHEDENRLAASLEIVMGKGEKPKGDFNVYDAAEVANAIRSRGVR